MPTIFKQLAYLVQRHRREAELADEMAVHREMTREALEARGVPPDESGRSQSGDLRQ
jgi:hypothetical protein